MLQGPLILDKPYPYAQPNDQLPFCNTFSQCTCCNASHALTIQTVLSGAYADMSIPEACRDALKSHSCSVCDPWVCCFFSSCQTFPGNKHQPSACCRPAILRNPS